MVLFAGCASGETPSSIDGLDPHFEAEDSDPPEQPPAGRTMAQPNDLVGASSLHKTVVPDEPLVYTPRTVPTDPELRVAFVGDQGIGVEAMQVMEFIAQEADLVVWLGDYDYLNSPPFWKTQMDVALGEDFPWLAAIGNHDSGTTVWPAYAAIIDEHIATDMPDAVCDGETGINQSCTYRGLRVLLSGVGTKGEDQEQYLQDQLVADDHIWRVCAWHKNQRDMQVGLKSDEVGWDAYRVCQDGAAIITTGHEHSYSRTYTLTDVGNRLDGHGAYGAPDTMLVSEGSTFVTVSGTAGQPFRVYEASYHDADTWWASWYTSNSYKRNGKLVPLGGAPVHGALIITFNVDGDPYRAHGEWMTYKGEIIDSFDVLAF
jgi:hypothetical protein